MNEIESLKQRFCLKKHFEGGYYSETYRSKSRFNLGGDASQQIKRSASTAIYYLLPEGERSHLHRLKSDEIWHFYSGGPLRVVEVSEEFGLRETVLGDGDRFQYVVKAGVWFAAKPLEGSTYSFVGCTVSPGFELEDFEAATLDLLPDLHLDQIKRVKEFILK